MITTVISNMSVIFEPEVTKKPNVREFLLDTKRVIVSLVTQVCFGDCEANVVAASEWESF